MEKSENMQPDNFFKVDQFLETISDETSQFYLIKAENTRQLKSWYDRIYENRELLFSISLKKELKKFDGQFGEQIKQSSLDFEYSQLHEHPTYATKNKKHYVLLTCKL